MSPQPLQLVHVDPTVTPADGDVPVYDAGSALYVPTASISGNVTAAGTLTSNQIVIGQGAKAIATLGSLGTTTTLLHGNAAGAPTFGTVVEADITLADNTTNDASTSAHGFLKKLDNSASSFMNGQGNWATPSGAGNVNASGTLTSGQLVIGQGTTSIAVGDLSGAVTTSGSAVTSVGTIPGRLIGVQYITTTGAYTYTPTSGTTAVVIELQGGGAGGGGITQPASGQVSPSGSGSAGGYVLKRLTANFSGATGVVGAKGAGGTAGSNSGNNGTNTTFIDTAGSPTTYTAGGGVAGPTSGAGGAAPYQRPGVAGGTATNGDLNIPGGPSNFSYSANTGMVSSAPGGASRFSGGAAGVHQGSSGSSAGVAATGYGGGGSGAVGNSNSGGNKAGGDGSDGIVIIWEYS